MSQVIITSRNYLLQSRQCQEQLDIVANSIKNLTTTAAPQPATLTLLVAIINDMRTMDTSVWAFTNPAASQTFPTYAVTDKISRGPYGSNSDATQAMIAVNGYLLPIVKNIQTIYTNLTATPDIISQEAGTQFQVYPIQSGFTTAYNDIITKLATVITNLPTLTGA